MSEKFRLSKNVTISTIDDEEIPGQYREGHYVLADAASGKAFLINETIYYFTSKFSSPKSRLELLKEIETETGTAQAAIEETCNEFFSFLCSRKILVPENQEEESAIKVKPLHKKGDRIDNFIILEILANKRSIDIYKAFDENEKRNCVIKLVNRLKIAVGTSFDKELWQLEREFSLLEKVKNISAISQAYGFYKHSDEYAYISLEYIEGRSLSGFIRKSKALTKRRCMQVIEDMLQAFSLLHDTGLIHGDIHASNVIVSESGSVRIIDLGLSRNPIADKNEVLKFGGVHYYMPPERINTTSLKKYSKEPDFYSDVYQIGLLIYLVIYNKLPFQGFIWEELATNIKEGKVDYPLQSFLKHRVSLTLIGIIKKCLDINPVKRYTNATRILQDFHELSFPSKQDPIKENAHHY